MVSKPHSIGAATSHQAGLKEFLAVFRKNSVHIFNLFYLMEKYSIHMSKEKQEDERQSGGNGK